MPKTHDLTNTQWFQSRIFQLSVFAQVLVFVLLSRLWYLQIVKGGYFEKRAKENHLRLIPLRAPRGLIFDRENRLLANNRPVYTISIIPLGVLALDKVVQELSLILHLSPSEINAKIAKQKAHPFRPVKLITDVTMRELSVISERRRDFPGVIVETEHQRNYLFNSLAAHLLGYVGEISEDLLATPEFASFAPGDQSGQMGLEKTFDKYLQGQNGGNQVEVDAYGRELRTLFTQKPVPGNSLKLTIDLDLQRAAEEALGEASGVVVAMNPNNGEILAMVSHPGFDPNLFAGGISSDEWQILSNNPAHPLVNRAISSHYPPGSIFKVIPAAAGLEEKVITFSDRFFCGGSFYLGNYSFGCWKVNGHGTVNVEEAIRISCDVFFYNTGYRLGVQKLNNYAFRFRLGEKTGIDLNNEIGGLIPTPQWKKAVTHQPWYPGDNLQFAIGQGEILVTPLQLLNVYATIANGGTIYRPLVVKEIRTLDNEEVKTFAPEILGELNISQSTLNIIRLALWKVVNHSGTGIRTFIKGADICGKTGTAQISEYPYEERTKETVPYKLRPHAWFASYAPYKNPQIAVLALVEHGGEGSSNAAPVVKKIYQEYFKDKQLDTEILEKYAPPISPQIASAALTELAAGAGTENQPVSQERAGE